ncbi:hypothetical protein EDB87DRAFT_1632633 [Lactarius vividus]|nr:hypothetical protein EDB87DRAFT_1632633 [Lactarius vividus]
MSIYWLFCVFLQSGFTTGMPQEKPTRKKWPAASLDVTRLPLSFDLSNSQLSLVIQLNYHRNCPGFMHSCSMMTC